MDLYVLTNSLSALLFAASAVGVYVFRDELGITGVLGRRSPTDDQENIDLEPLRAYSSEGADRVAMLSIEVQERGGSVVRLTLKAERHKRLIARFLNVFLA